MSEELANEMVERLDRVLAMDAQTASDLEWSELLAAAMDARDYIASTPRAVETTDGMVERAAVYREIFDEITLKAEPLYEDQGDPDRVSAYRVPVGPIHRACGKVHHHMLGIAENVNRAVEGLRKYEMSDEAKRAIAEIEHNMATAVDRINASGWPYYHAISAMRPDDHARVMAEARYLLYRLCDAYELVCSDTGKNYHHSPGSVYAHCRALLPRIDALLALSVGVEMQGNEGVEP